MCPASKSQLFICATCHCRVPSSSLSLLLLWCPLGLGQSPCFSRAGSGAKTAACVHHYLLRAWKGARCFPGINLFMSYSNFVKEEPLLHLFCRRANRGSGVQTEAKTQHIISDKYPPLKRFIYGFIFEKKFFSTWSEEGVFLKCWRWGSGERDGIV